jgi:hypothetical protein
MRDVDRMRIRFTKLSDRRHVLEVERGGRRECVQLESRSTLHHDLAHLAVEEAAGIEDGFFGSLAKGASLGGLAGDYAASMLQVERTVAVLQRLAKIDEDPAALHARIVDSLDVQGEAPPSWFTADFVRTVRERLRALVGRWRATPYGSALEVDWESGRGPRAPSAAQESAKSEPASSSRRDASRATP